MIKKTAVASAVSLLIAGNALAANTYFDARNDAMGGVGVASSMDNSALLANPALIAKTNKLSLTIPSLGLQLSDKNHLIDEFKKIKSKVDEYESNRHAHLMNAQQGAGELKSILEAVKDKNVNFNIGLSASVIIPSETNKIGLFAKTHADATVHTMVDEADLRLLNLIQNGQVPAVDFEHNTDSELRGLASWVTDYGVSVARSFEVAGKPLHIGLSPKMQEIKIYNYAVGVNKFDRKDMKASQYQSQHKKFNVDLGVAAELSEQLTVGLVGKNLLRNKLETKAINDKSFTYETSPLVTAGASYRWERFTAAADVDLTPIKAFSNQKGNQYAAVGAEWEALSWAKLRAGYRIDMKNSKPNMATVGFGFHPGEKVKFDVTGMVGSKRNLGAALQLSIAI
ncbi:conjugal transfer protein TraF [unidentified bacterial endosymbiont]|uniref:conjugal transfer protein TraF n=1 Tax=unidentified bacterial endosymbiont TaxID=2355 RepID=UPI0020A21F37|nr:conjugal transfer protein TraF [unidentified bacterial endosymbiont]